MSSVFGKDYRIARDRYRTLAGLWSVPGLRQRLPYPEHTTTNAGQVQTADRVPHYVHQMFVQTPDLPYGWRGYGV